MSCESQHRSCKLLGGKQNDPIQNSVERPNPNVLAAFVVSVSVTVLMISFDGQAYTHGPAHETLTVAGQLATHDTKGNMTSIPVALRPGSNPLAMNWEFRQSTLQRRRWQRQHRRRDCAGHGAVIEGESPSSFSMSSTGSLTPVHRFVT